MKAAMTLLLIFVFVVGLVLGAFLIAREAFYEIRVRRSRKGRIVSEPLRREYLHLDEPAWLRSGSTDRIPALKLKLTELGE